MGEAYSPNSAQFGGQALFFFLVVFGCLEDLNASPAFGRLIICSEWMTRVKSIINLGFHCGLVSQHLS